MKFKLIGLTFAVLTFTFAAAAQTPAPSPSPTPKATPTLSPSPTPHPAAVDISGRWDVVADAGGQSIDITMEFKQTGTDFTGTTTAAIGSGTISAGKLADKAFTASLVSDVQGQAYEFKVSGTVEGDAIRGTFNNPDLGTVPFSGKRAAKKN